MCRGLPGICRLSCNAANQPGAAPYQIKPTNPVTRRNTTIPSASAGGRRLLPQQRHASLWATLELCELRSQIRAQASATRCHEAFVPAINSARNSPRHRAIPHAKRVKG